MNIKLIQIGKTDNSALISLIDIYQKRLSKYIGYSTEIISDIKNTKNLSFSEQKTKEGIAILSKLNPSDFVVLLDERGKEYTSTEFAGYLQKRMNASTKSLVFIIGGAYGFSKEVYERANQKISLSKMTFSHQMVRLFFTEQLYRGFSIIHNEPYHHN